MFEFINTNLFLDKKIEEKSNEIIAILKVLNTLDWSK